MSDAGRLVLAIQHRSARVPSLVGMPLGALGLMTTELVMGFWRATSARGTLLALLAVANDIGRTKAILASQS